MLLRKAMKCFIKFSHQKGRLLSSVPFWPGKKVVHEQAGGSLGTKEEKKDPE